MSIFEEIEQLLNDLDAFIAGGQPEAMVGAAESKLGVSFPPSFREYLVRWGNISCDDLEYYGLTRNGDFDKGGVPNCVWFTMSKRTTVGLPHSLIVFRNINDEEYLCIDIDQALDNDERKIAIWDNIEREISQTLDVNFADFLLEELTEISDDA